LNLVASPVSDTEPTVKTGPGTTSTVTGMGLSRGNSGTGGSSSGAGVQVDNTAPTVATVLANATTNDAGWLTQGGTYRVYANVADLPSGSGGYGDAGLAKWDQLGRKVYAADGTTVWQLSPTAPS